MALFPSTTAVLLVGILLVAAGAIAGGARIGGRIDPLAQVRGRLLAAIGTAVLLLLTCAAVDAAVPQALGRPLTAAPGVAAAGALVAFGAVPWRRARAVGERTATLRRRTLADAAGPAAVLSAAGAALLLAAVLAVAALTAASDGRSFTVAGPGWSGTAGPYPGAFYGLPIAGSLVLLAGATALALRRAALLPEVFEDAGRDRRWRRGTGAAVLAVTAAACLLDLAGVLWAAAGTLRSTVGSADLNGFTIDGTLRVLLPVTAVGCGLCALAAVAVLVLAVARAVAVGRGPLVAAA